MNNSAAEVTQAAVQARIVARAAAAAARLTRTRSRLLRGQSAALRAKHVAAAGRTPTTDAYKTMLAELFASSDLMTDLWRSPVPAGRQAALHAACCAHHRILARYAALGPSLPN
jgi:hypothetical protein